MIVIRPFSRTCAMVSRTASGEVDIGNLQRAEHRERVAVALGGDVDVAAGPVRVQARSSRHKVDRLTGDKLPEPLIQLRVDLAHDALQD